MVPTEEERCQVPQSVVKLGMRGFLSFRPHELTLVAQMARKPVQRFVVLVPISFAQCA